MDSLLYVTAFILLVLFWGGFEEVKSRNLIKIWAKGNNFQIIHLDRRSAFKRGPFKITSNLQTVFYVTVEDDGVIKNAYIKCGSPWIGLLRDCFEVKWV